MKTVRCKFKCISVTQMENGDEVKLEPVTHGSPENERFFKYTPYGNLTIGLIPDGTDMFIPGKEYYLDITPAVVPVLDHLF